MSQESGQDKVMWLRGKEPRAPCNTSRRSVACKHQHQHQYGLSANAKCSHVRVSTSGHTHGEKTWPAGPVDRGSAAIAGRTSPSQDIAVLGAFGAFGAFVFSMQGGTLWNKAPALGHTPHAALVRAGARGIASKLCPINSYTSSIKERKAASLDKTSLRPKVCTVHLTSIICISILNFRRKSNLGCTPLTEVANQRRSSRDTRVLRTSRLLTVIHGTLAGKESRLELWGGL